MSHDLMTEILQEVREIRSDIKRIDITLERNTVSLELHMKRSDALEKLVTAQGERFKPVEAHVAVVGGVMKVLLGVGALAGAAAAVWRVFS